MTTPGYPLIAWGDAADLSAWPLVVGTPTFTASQTDPFGGTDAFLIEDNDAALREGVAMPVTAAANNTVTLFMKAGTSARSASGFWDVNATTFRHYIQIDWSGGVPTPTTFVGAGTVYDPIAVGGGWYMIRYRPSAAAIDLTHTHRVFVYPVGDAVSLTGTAYVYMRNAVTLNPLDEMAAWPEPREGYRKVRAPSGEFDVWDAGNDQYLDAVARFVPAYDTDDPNVSGWYGPNTEIGVNCGVAAMLTAGRQGHDLIYCPDRADASDYIASELVEPMTEGVELAPNGQRHVRFRLRNTTTEYPAYDV